MMKKLFTLFAILGVMSLSAQTLLVEWSFPNNSADEMADAGIPENLDKIIYTEGGTSAIQYKNGFDTKAAQVTQWENGINTKGWVVSLETTGFADIKLNSKQQSGGNEPGPKDWKLQYKIGTGGSWIDIGGSDYFVYNDWTSGEQIDVALPTACDNQALVFIRWLITSEIASDTTTLLSTGKSKIDDIIIYGTPTQSVQSLENNKSIVVYPNPANDFINFSNTENIHSVRIINQFGSEVYNSELHYNKIDVSSLSTGIYFIIPVSENKTFRAIKFVKK